MKLNLLAPFNMRSYGVVSFNVLQQLLKDGVDVTSFGIGGFEIQSKEQNDALNATYYAKRVDYDFHSPCLKIFHQNQMAEMIGKGPHYGYTFFETDPLNAQEIHHLSSLDGVFVASKWAEGIVTAAKEVHGQVVNVGAGVDRSIFHEGVNIDKDTLGQIPALANLSSKTVFLSVGKWEVRKGHDVLVEAFNDAFTPKDNACLMMAAYNPFIGKENDEWAKTYLNSANGKNIIILPFVPNQGYLAGIMSLADAGVFPSRAEGFNLPALEMLSMGKYVIATNYSAHTEFLTPENSRLIPMDELEPANDGKWFHGDANWGLWDHKQHASLIHWMRDVHSLKQSGRLETNLEGIKTAERFSWAAVTSKITEVIKSQAK